TQLFVTARYIELNPVAAEMRSSPEDWERSSCSAHLGRAHPPRFLARDDFLGFVARDQQPTRPEYERFLRAGVAMARARNRERRVAAMMLPDVPAWVDVPTHA